MNKLKQVDLVSYVESNIDEFHAKKLEKVKSINLGVVLKSKNPYLFKAKNVTKASELISGILEAYISSSEEGIFGNWLERLAVHINNLVYGGQKAAVAGIDLDFTNEDIRYLVTIKSGPVWGNDSQQKKMIDQFNTARRILKTSGTKINIICVNGCCYGRSRPTSEYKEKGDFYKLCGQRFWQLISGENDLYKELIVPIGHDAKKHNEAFKESYDALLNRLTKEFLNEFSTASGEINWEKLIIYNSSWQS
jgi:hypothetical protein